MSDCHCPPAEFTVTFLPIQLGAEGIWVGFKRVIEVEFKTGDISGDTFTAEIKDSAGLVVDTLTIGDGITIGGTTILQLMIEPPVTTNAGRYSLTVIWTEAATGAVGPFSYGFITVIPVPGT